MRKLSKGIVLTTVTAAVVAGVVGTSGAAEASTVTRKATTVTVVAPDRKAVTPDRKASAPSVRPSAAPVEKERLAPVTVVIQRKA